MTPQLDAPCDTVPRELSPGKSIRAYCLWCCLGKSNEVKFCPAEACALWPWRFGHRPETRGLERRPDGKTATQAIYNRCRDCYEFRKDCGIPETDCDLHHVNRQRFPQRAKARRAVPDEAQTAILPRQNGPTAPLRRKAALAGTPAGAQAQRRGRP